ncbi:hypothetical protein M0R45_006972 [Rubus argutus]|uniref:Uncharacterized protein n=1 Tax=Rubus argutus TaxID=59490 RepID=A0AAW1YSB2_RUBAR
MWHRRGLAEPVRCLGLLGGVDGLCRLGSSLMEARRSKRRRGLAEAQATASETVSAAGLRLGSGLWLIGGGDEGCGLGSEMATAW